jgi:hypothetical protein
MRRELARRDMERRDLGRWALLAGGGLALTALAVRSGARLGTAGAPFLGHYRIEIGAVSILAPLVATVVVVLSARGWLDRAGWPAVLLTGYAATLGWALSLALVDGTGGLTRALLAEDSYLTDVVDVGDDPLGYLATFTERGADHSPGTRGHPPGPVLLLWLATRTGLSDHLLLGLLVTAVGAGAVPLVLSAVRGVCGEPSARRYLPVLVLAPYAIWLAVSVDALVTALTAAMMAAGVRASAPARTGWSAAAWAVLCGVVLGLAALLSYAAAWLGLSVVCLYFARRRPFLNLATGVGALIPLLAAQLAGFNWADGLLAAQSDYATRVGRYRSGPWWAGISLVALLLAAGPPLVASMRKGRNTPGWPFLVGAGAAVLFSIVAGLARGGAEHAWLPFFPWLTVAAVAPDRRNPTVAPGSTRAPPATTGGPSPLLLVAVGAVTAVVVEAVLATPW